MAKGGISAHGVRRPACSQESRVGGPVDGLRIPTHLFALLGAHEVVPLVPRRQGCALTRLPILFEGEEQLEVAVLPETLRVLQEGSPQRPVPVQAPEAHALIEAAERHADGGREEDEAEVSRVQDVFHESHKPLPQLQPFPTPLAEAFGGADAEELEVGALGLRLSQRRVHEGDPKEDLVAESMALGEGVVLSQRGRLQGHKEEIRGRHDGDHVLVRIEVFAEVLTNLCQSSTDVPVSPVERRVEVHRLHHESQHVVSRDEAEVDLHISVGAFDEDVVPDSPRCHFTVYEGCAIFVNTCCFRPTHLRWCQPLSQRPQKKSQIPAQ